MARRSIFLVLMLLAMPLASCRTLSFHPECGLFNQGTSIDIVADLFNGGRFEPRVLCVKVGSTVRWRSLDEMVDHTVTSVADDPTQFGSGSISYGQSFSMVFKRPGQYAYVCSFHPDMAGLITVLSP